MRGVGGPLLCIGDLLSDVAADDSGDSGSQEGSPPSSPTVASGNPVHPSHLHQLFEVIPILALILQTHEAIILPFFFWCAK